MIGDATLRTALERVETFDDLRQIFLEIRRSQSISVGEVANRTSIPVSSLSSIYFDRVPSGRPMRWDSFVKVLLALEIHDIDAWHLAYRRASKAHQGATISAPAVSVAGSENVNVTINTSHTSKASDTFTKSSQQRQEFFFRFLNHSLWLTTSTFVLALLFTSAAAVVTLWGAVIMIMNIGSPFDYAPLLATLSGLVVGAGGGALTVHAYKARTHVTKEVAEVRKDIRGDIAFERATQLIDRVQDSHTKDHLLSLTAAKELGLAPTPIDMGQLPQPKRVEVERVDPPGRLQP